MQNNMTSKLITLSPIKKIISYDKKAVEQSLSTALLIHRNRRINLFNTLNLNVWLTIRLHLHLSSRS